MKGKRSVCGERSVGRRLRSTPLVKYRMFRKCRYRRKIQLQNLLSENVKLAEELKRRNRAFKEHQDALTAQYAMCAEFKLETQALR